MLSNKNNFNTWLVRAGTFLPTAASYGSAGTGQATPCRATSALVELYSDAGGTGWTTAAKNYWLGGELVCRGGVPLG